MRISDWSSDVCSSDLRLEPAPQPTVQRVVVLRLPVRAMRRAFEAPVVDHEAGVAPAAIAAAVEQVLVGWQRVPAGLQGIEVGHRHAAQPGHRVRAEYGVAVPARSEEHTSELQSLMRISYAVFRLQQ